MNDIILKLYAVRNQEGKFFRSKGCGGYGDSWVDSINKGKIYPRIGPAKSVATYWSRSCPKFGVPEVVELHVMNMVVIDQTKRIAKANRAEEKRLAKWEAEENERKLQQAKKDYEKARKELERLNNAN